MIEGVKQCDVMDKEGADGAMVAGVGEGNGSEGLLPGSVLLLQLSVDIVVMVCTSSPCSIHSLCCAREGRHRVNVCVLWGAGDAGMATEH